MDVDAHDNTKLESHTGMCLVDEDGLIVEWSPGQEALTGIGRMEALGRSVWDVQYEFLDNEGVDAEDYARLRKVFSQILSTGQVPPNLHFVDMPLERRDGERSVLQLTVSPIKTAAGYMLSCVFRDVTEQNRMEAALQQARAEAEMANRAKGQFLARMSHEIRTPLHGITGLTQVLSNTSLTMEQQQYVDMIRSSGDLLLQVVNEILDFSKIESGRLELEVTPFDLREVVEHAADAVALHAFEKGIELIVQITPPMTPVLIGDPGRLQQVLVNLLNNAVKFTIEGQVLLRVRAEPLEAQTTRVTLSVEDTGIGIAQEKLDLIFQAFRQSDDSTTRQYGGTGLGLAIASQLVELMGGRIEVESALNHGSRFQFSLTCTSQGPTAAAQSPSEWQALRVLIVDDNAAVRVAIEEMLGTWGFRTSNAESGESALRELERARACGQLFRLVLLDATIPAANGLAVAVARGHPPQTALIMLLPPTVIHEELERHRQLTIGGWLPKPVKYPDLHSAVRRILERSGSDLEPEGDQLHRRTRDLSFRPLRILLADDNRGGLVIGEWMLRQLGHTVETASDGQQVLDKFRSAKFDLILIDLEMPHVDGWQATRMIREQEVALGLGHVPIIAVTADASNDLRTTIMQSGMDGHLFKPFNLERLEETLKPFLTSIGPAPGLPVFDHALALESVDGSDEILAEAVEVFLDEDYPRHLQALKSAVEARDGEVIRKAAHGLKGALATFGAIKAADVARQLQEIGMQGETDLAAGELAQLERQVDRFSAAYSTFLRPSSPSDGASVLGTN
jgi:two-component system, sensor histidine kinase and response regulator